MLSLKKKKKKKKKLLHRKNIVRSPCIIPSMNCTPFEGYFWSFCQKKRKER